MNPLFRSIFSTEFAFATIRVMTPILLPALGVAISSMAGSVNIALEGVMLVSAFSGTDVMKSAYAHAIKTGYRFYSYGDSSLLFRAYQA